MRSPSDDVAVGLIQEFVHGRPAEANRPLLAGPSPELVQLLLSLAGLAEGKVQGRRIWRLARVTIDVAARLANKRLEADTLAEAAEILRSSGLTRRAAQLWVVAFRRYRRLTATAESARCLRNIAECHLANGHPEKALTGFRQALMLDQRYSERHGEGEDFLHLGLWYHNLGDFRQAQAHHMRALEIGRAIGDWRLEATALDLVGQSRCYLGELEQALANHKESLAIYLKLRDGLGIASTLNHLGLVYQCTGEPQKALECHESALKNYRRVQDREGEAHSWGNLGNVRMMLGDASGALDCYSQALRTYEDLGDRQAQGSAWGNMAAIYAGQGDFPTALAYLDRALAIHNQIGFQRGIVDHLGQLGMVHWHIGSMDHAEQFFREGVERAQQTGYRMGEVANLGNLAAVYWHAGNLEKAQARYEESLDVARQISYQHGISAALTGLGVIYSARRDYVRSLVCHEEAWRSDQEAGNSAGEEADLGNLGNVYRLMGDFAKAHEYLTRAVTLADQLDLPLAQMQNHFTRGMTYEQSGDFQASIADYEVAVDIIEHTRGRLEAEAQRIDFLADRLAPYRRLALVLIYRLGKPGMALKYVEHSRSRTFLDLLSASRLRAVKQGEGLAPEPVEQLRKRLVS